MFPDTITSTMLRPDMILMSEATKQVVLLGLTVPWEDRMQERKRSKYAPLVTECRRLGWKAHCEPIEVDCRGFAGGTLGSVGSREARPPRTSWKAQKGFRWLWIKWGDK